MRCTDDLSSSQRGEYYCQALFQREVHDTQPTWIVVSDPSDPAFYSTCYVRAYPNVNFNKPPAVRARDESPQWRFGRQCATCASVAAAAYPQARPMFEMADKCVDCELEGLPTVTPPLDTTVTPDPIFNGTVCDGVQLSTYDDYTQVFFGGVFDCARFIGDGAQTKVEVNATVRWQNASSHSCPEGAAAKCFELMPRPKPRRNAVSLGECLAWAATNPNCSTLVTHSPGYPYYCSCFAKRACCQRCAGTISWDNSVSYDFAPAAAVRRADPSCANGRRSDDGSLCCEASCSRCLPGSPWGIYDQGICLGAMITPTRTCDKFSAPCVMKK